MKIILFKVPNLMLYVRTLWNIHPNRDKEYTPHPIQLPFSPFSG